MITTLIHIFSAGIWLGTAVTLPFWGNRVNNADNLSTVLTITDMVFVLKCVLIMGGLVLTLSSGIYLSEFYNFPYFNFSNEYVWLGLSQTLCLVIAVNSLIILFLMIAGRRGQRSKFRYVPPIGYNNIGFIAMLYVQMVLKPDWSQQGMLFFAPLTIILVLDVFYIRTMRLRIKRLRSMTPQQYVQRYFDLLEKEDMTMFFRLFHNDAEFYDPFASEPVIGMKAIERFFQRLGDQFEKISIVPKKVIGDTSRIITQWEATGITKNGEPMQALNGVNVMQLDKGKINRIEIFFDLNKLPRIRRVSPALV